MSERPKERASKARVGETQPWVQIPPPPPSIIYLPHEGKKRSLMISTIHFRRILRITSLLTSLLHPLIRLKIASWIKIPGLQTLLNPNSIRGYAKLRTKAYFKEITFEDDTKLVVDLNDIIGFRSALKGTWDPTCLKLLKNWI